MYSLALSYLLAGHETTASTLGWMLLEMHTIENTIRSRGNSEFKHRPSDFDAIVSVDCQQSCVFWVIPVLSHFWHMQEKLRYQPVANNIFREAIKDDLLFLSKPIITSSGKTIYEIPVPKGLNLLMTTTDSRGAFIHWQWWNPYHELYQKLGPIRWGTPTLLIHNGGCIME